MMDPDNFGFLITDISGLIRAEMDRRASEAGIRLTPGERRALVHAARAGAVRQNVLAERMGLEAMTLSTYVDRLEAEGLVERRPDPTDRRAKIVRLTEAADGVINSIAPELEAIRVDASHGISPQDWERFLDLLKAVRANIAASRSAASRRTKNAA